MELEYPLMLLSLPLPWIIYRYAPAFRTSDEAIKVPFFRRIIELSGERLTTGGQVLTPMWWQKLCLVFVWIMLVIAACKPVVLGEPQTFTKAGRDLMVVVDLSGSMETSDFKLPGSDEPISRLEALKNVLSEFSGKREGDRLGLILFGDRAYLQAPFTADHKTWLSLVQETQVGMAGQSTHIGDALGLAMKVIAKESTAFEESGDESNQAEKVIILLTDGNDTDSQVPPIEAASLARDVNVRIHTIAIGDPETVGESAMNIEELEKIARLSGGESFQAMSYQELQAIYTTLNKLEPSEYASFSYQPKISAHHVPLCLGLGVYLFAYIVNFMSRVSFGRERRGE
ncbi:VWA domain-containing protein [Vibrio campbellii]|uniref:VWA domain-containing protein n=1 Tax=Vibrio campbellii TaxID=680 RepID=UPI004055E54F